VGSQQRTTIPHLRPRGRTSAGQHVPASCGHSRLGSWRSSEFPTASCRRTLRPWTSPRPGQSSAIRKKLGHLRPVDAWRSWSRLRLSFPSFF
jgi:hypothetical protein